LLAAGGALDTATLQQAYAQSIFPWFSAGQPLLWWSTDPRMVLRPESFRLHRSLAKTLKKFMASPACELRFDSAFSAVIRACASSRRGTERDEESAQDAAPSEDNGPANNTWIVPQMVRAYEALHRIGLAHSVETWVEGELVGGLYCVALGHAVFGESMFSRRTDASKIALAGLVAFCRAQGVRLIDCQQNTSHLASLGGAEISRSQFAAHVAQACQLPALSWQFDARSWDLLFRA
jgi:leucyl/phenylalanyl-tRNA--protein transferase